MSKDNKNLNIIIAILVVLALAVAGYFLYKKYQQKNLDPQAQTANIEEQKKGVFEKVITLVSVPEESPLFFTVSSSTLLKTQDFFKDTENGDILLVFETNKYAVLYRESSNQVINAGPIVDSTANANNKATTTNETVKSKK